MKFSKKTWKNRITEFPTRRMLTKEDGSTELVTVARYEGDVSQEGDAFSEDTMNDLEDRIEEAFDDVQNTVLNGLSFTAITAEEFSAIEEKDENTVYFIVD